MNKHLQALVEFMKPGCKAQNGRVMKLGELASKIGVEHQRKRVRELVTIQKRIHFHYKRLEEKIRQLIDDMRVSEAEGRPIKVRCVVIMVLNDHAFDPGEKFDEIRYTFS